MELPSKTISRGYAARRAVRLRLTGLRCYLFFFLRLRRRERYRFKPRLATRPSFEIDWVPSLHAKKPLFESSFSTKGSGSTAARKRGRLPAERPRSCEKIVRALELLEFRRTWRRWRASAEPAERAPRNVAQGESANPGMCSCIKHKPAERAKEQVCCIPQYCCTVERIQRCCF